MTHNRNVYSDDSGDGVIHIDSAFKFDRRSACLNQTNSAAHTLFRVDLIRAKWQITNEQGPWVCSGNKPHVVFHFRKSDGNGVSNALHYRPNRISYKDNVDARLVDDGCKRRVVGGDHSDELRRTEI